MVELSVLDVGRPLDVLLGKHLGALHRLDEMMVVVLVDLLVDGLVDLLVLDGSDRLVDDGWGGLLVDRRVVVAGEEVADGRLGFVHLETMLRWMSRRVICF